MLPTGSDLAAFGLHARQLMSDAVFLTRPRTDPSLPADHRAAGGYCTAHTHLRNYTRTQLWATALSAQSAVQRRSHTAVPWGVAHSAACSARHDRLSQAVAPKMLSFAPVRLTSPVFVAHSNAESAEPRAMRQAIVCLAGTVQAAFRPIVTTSAIFRSAASHRPLGTTSSTQPSLRGRVLLAGMAPPTGTAVWPSMTTSSCRSMCAT